jgi:hypothetical protein
MSDIIGAALEAKAVNRAMLLRALAGMPEPEHVEPDHEPRAGSFDGGARPIAPHVETPGETLMRIIGDRGARVSHFE